MNPTPCQDHVLRPPSLRLQTSYNFSKELAIEGSVGQTRVCKISTRNFRRFLSRYVHWTQLVQMIIWRAASGVASAPEPPFLAIELKQLIFGKIQKKNIVIDVGC